VQEAKKESEELLANVAGADARQKVTDAIKQLGNGATSLE
jgi:hypothetical protein